MDKRNIALTIAYHGAPFAGWQKTPSKLSVEAALEGALQILFKSHTPLQAASRTDAGVHARGQVVNFLTDHPMPLQELCYRLNGLLPKEITILCAEDKGFHFHSTLSCLKKQYGYHLCYGPWQLPFYRDTSWHFPHTLDLAAMQEGAALLLGTHDFSTFCNERALWDRSPICTLETIQLLPLEGMRLKMVVIGDHFLYKMVRNLVGTLAYVGCGKLSAKTLPSLLLQKDRRLAGITAPAHGLCLEQVIYRDDDTTQ